MNNEKIGGRDMKNFIYETPTKVYFGKGEENNIGRIIAEYKPPSFNISMLISTNGMYKSHF